MYIQPYETQDTLYGPAASQEFGALAACAPARASIAGDGVSSTMPWTQEIPELGDAAGALEDAPFGALGLGPMLSNLTGMMQQLVQMMQTLVARMGGEQPGTTQGGCTRQIAPPH